MILTLFVKKKKKNTGNQSNEDDMDGGQRDA
jgi:hypothetical protein